MLRWLSLVLPEAEEERLESEVTSEVEGTNKGGSESTQGDNDTHFHVRASERWYTDVRDGALSGVTVGTAVNTRCA